VILKFLPIIYFLIQVIIYSYDKLFSIILKNLMNNKQILIINLIEETEKKSKLIDNLINEIESIKKEKLELEINLQNYISNSNINNTKEIMINNDIKHLKVNNFKFLIYIK